MHGPEKGAGERGTVVLLGTYRQAEDTTLVEAEGDSEREREQSQVDGGWRPPPPPPPLEDTDQPAGQPTSR